MMKLTSTLILFVLLLDACIDAPPTDKLFTLPKKWPIPDSNCNKLKLKFKKGYIEFFSINNSKFRFLESKKVENKYDLQVLQKGDWLTNLTLPMPRYTFNLFNDIDLDNHFDLTFLENENIVTYFFNKSNGQFDISPMKFSYDYALLDRSRLVYGANNKTMENWDIEIFSIKDHTQRHLLRSKIYLSDNPNNGRFEITKARIYKCRNGLESDTTLIYSVNINKQFGDFNLLNFMKDLASNPICR